jgi:hypothetical protein
MSIFTFKKGKMDKLLQSLVSTLLPEEISLHFELVSVIEHPDRIELRMEEYAELVPENMADSSHVVLDGFCNPVELLNYPLRDKPTYLKIYRRRWKASGSNEHYSNTYDLHPEGVKATHSFATFLKETVGYTPEQYIHDFYGTSD